MDIFLFFVVHFFSENWLLFNIYQLDPLTYIYISGSCSYRVIQVEVIITGCTCLCDKRHRNKYNQKPVQFVLHIYYSGNDNTVKYTKHDSHNQIWKTTISCPIYLSFLLLRMNLSREFQLCARYVSFHLLHYKGSDWSLPSQDLIVRFNSARLSIK